MGRVGCLKFDGARSDIAILLGQTACQNEGRFFFLFLLHLDGLLFFLP